MRWRTVDQLTLVASIYRIAIADGTSPVDAVAARLGITPEAAKQRIRRSRRAGLLAPLDIPAQRGDTFPARRMP